MGHLDNKHSVFGRVVGGLKLLDVFNTWETDEKDRPQKEIRLLRTEVFKNPFKEAIAEAAKPKVEKEIDPVATWFSNRRDPMQEHRNRNSVEVCKYLEDGVPGSGVKPLPVALAIPTGGTAGTGADRKPPPKELPDEEMEYANVARKSKKARTSFDFSS